MQERDDCDTPDEINDAFSELYSEICSLAERKLVQHPNQSISAIDLVHATYLRLSKSTKGDSTKWRNKRFFFSVAATTMRRILVERIRAKNRLKRGGELNQTEMTISRIAVQNESLDIEALDEALKQLESIHPDEAELVNLKYFVGMQWGEIAEIRDESVRTVRRKWSFARAWLRDAIHTDLELNDS